MILKINEKKLVEFLLQCHPSYPRAWKGWEVDHQGRAFSLPSIGGITLNIGVGDSAFGWAGDHVEPGVSCTVGENVADNPNRGLQTYACVGNVAKIISGKAKGAQGYVIGHHGGAENLIVQFPKSVKSKMTYEDKIIIHAVGQGLKLMEYPQIHLLNLSPLLLKRMKIKTSKKKNQIKVPVTTIVPAECMGSGIGASSFMTGDYDVMTSDESIVQKYKIDQMKFGDFIAILDHDTRYGASLRKGAISIGVVIHSDCLLSGHGPGITIVMTSPDSSLIPVLDSKANIGLLL